MKDHDQAPALVAAGILRAHRALLLLLLPWAIGGPCQPMPPCGITKAAPSLAEAEMPAMRSGGAPT